MNENEALKILKELVKLAQARNTRSVVLVEDPSDRDETRSKEVLLLTSRGLEEQSGLYSNTDEESYWQTPRSVSPNKELVRKHRLAEKFINRLLA